MLIVYFFLRILVIYNVDFHVLIRHAFSFCFVLRSLDHVYYDSVV